MSAPAADWATEEATYWREHRPRYLHGQQRTQPLPPPPFPLGVCISVPQHAAEVVPEPLSAPRRPLARPDDAAPPAPVRRCACGQPILTPGKQRCRSCAGSANAAARWAKPVAVSPPPVLAVPAAPDICVAPDPLTCPDCAAASVTGKRCRRCTMRAFWASKPPPPATGPTCPDCGAAVTRAGNRCRPCGYAALRTIADGQPRPSGRTYRVALCRGCGNIKALPSRGCCGYCHQRIRAGQLGRHVLAPAHPGRRQARQAVAS